MCDPKTAPAAYFALLSATAEKVLSRPHGQRPFVFAIDGFDGVGKSSAASWLAWQLGMPSIHLDIYLIPGTPISWRIDELRLAINARLEDGRPVIVEGILVLQALRDVKLKSDFLIFVENSAFPGSDGLDPQIRAYLAEYHPKETADFVVRWSWAKPESDS